MRLFNVLVLLLLASPLKAQETLSSLISESRTLALDGSSASRQRFTDAQIAQFLNEAQREALTQTRCLRQDQVFQLVPGTTYYPLPSNYLTIERVTVGSKWIQEMSPAALDARSRGWEIASGYPSYFFVNFSSRGLMGFAPWPATSTDTDTVKVEYDVQANEMVNGSDSPFNGINEMIDYQHGLAYFAASMMSMIQGVPTRAQAYQGVFASVVTGMTKQCLARPSYLPGATGSP